MTFCIGTDEHRGPGTLAGPSFPRDTVKLVSVTLALLIVHTSQLFQVIEEALAWRKNDLLFYSFVSFGRALVYQSVSLHKVAHCLQTSGS